MTTRTALVSGASIAGPATAFWLLRAGYDVTVVERADRARPGGQTVDLRGAGREVVDRMGLMDAVRDRCLDQAGMATVDGRGRMTSRMPVHAFAGEGIVSELEILRGDLADLLRGAVDAEWLWGDSVTALEETPDSVDVTFERNAPRRFDLVVGCDGLGSAVRRLAFGDAGLDPIGLSVAWFGAEVDVDLHGWYQMHNLPGGRVVSLRPDREPGRVKAALWWRSDDPLPADPAAFLRGHFADATWVVPQVLDALDRAEDLAVTPLAQVRLDRWTTGRLALVGDAAWCPTPLTGLGTSLALVGAYVLGTALADHGPAAAFARYEQVLRPYVAEAQKLPPGGVPAYAPKTAAMIRLRDLNMRMMTRWPLRAVIERQFAKAGAIALPEAA